MYCLVLKLVLVHLFEYKQQWYSMVKVARLDDAFSEFFKLEASPVEGQSLQQKDKKKRKRKGEKKLANRKPADIKILISAHA